MVSDAIGIDEIPLGSPPCNGALFVGIGSKSLSLYFRNSTRNGAVVICDLTNYVISSELDLLE